MRRPAAMARWSSTVVQPSFACVAQWWGRVSRVRVVVAGDVVYEGPLPTPQSDGAVEIAWLGAASIEERTLAVTLSLRGDDSLFTYVRGYALSLETSHPMTSSAVDLVVFDRGTATTPFGEGLTATWR